MTFLENEVQAVGARFTKTMLFVALNDGREIGLPLTHKWVTWLANATPEERDAWSIEPGGFAVYWEDLDNGLEVVHLLEHQAI